MDNVPPYGAKSAHIRSSPTNVRLLKLLSVGALNLANNHIFDYGLKGYQSTVDVLNSNGIAYFGVEGRELFVELAGGRLACHGYCSYNTNPLGVARLDGSVVNPLNVATVRTRLTENHRAGFLNVVSIHSGFEHVNCPSRDDIRMAREFARICPYVYYGHHPHVIQGVEGREGSVLAYSLGNFCFDDVYSSRSREPLVRQSENNRRGLIVELVVNGAGLVSYKLTGLYAGRDGLVVDPPSIQEEIERYSRCLLASEPIYSNRRDELIRAYLQRRKGMRDLVWYFKRLRFSSAVMLARSAYNSYQYKRNVQRFLDRDEERSES